MNHRNASNPEDSTRMFELVTNVYTSDYTGNTRHAIRVNGVWLDALDFDDATQLQTAQATLREAEQYATKRAERERRPMGVWVTVNGRIHVRPLGTAEGTDPLPCYAVLIGVTQ